MNVRSSTRPGLGDTTAHARDRNGSLMHAARPSRQRCLGDTGPSNRREYCPATPSTVGSADRLAPIAYRSAGKSKVRSPAGESPGSATVQSRTRPHCCSRTAVGAWPKRTRGYTGGPRRRSPEVLCGLSLEALPRIHQFAPVKQRLAFHELLQHTGKARFGHQLRLHLNLVHKQSLPAIGPCHCRQLNQHNTRTAA